MENLDPDKGRDLPQGQGSANMHSAFVGITRSYTTCGQRNYKKPPALGSRIIKRLFFSELMQSSARAFRLERGMRLEFGFQPEGGSWKLWEVGGGSKEKAARGLRK